MEFATPLLQNEIESYLELKFDAFYLLGRSVAGIETVITIPQLDLTFDTGRAPTFAYPMNHLALSHWHLDHAGGLAYYLGLRRLASLPALNIIVPSTKVAATQNYLEGLKQVCESKIEFKVLDAANSLRLRRDILLTSIPSYHCVPSCGYLILQHKKKLKPEYKNLSEAEIKALKMQGTPIETIESIPLLAYSGDTKGEFFATPASTAQYLMMECSFFGDLSEYDKVRHYGHTHILDWKNFADQIQSQHIIMIHTSQRYSKKEIELACQKNLPKHLLDRLIILR
ncbi:MAG: hypothetical protein HYU97_05030 [Deltaproteobacteria bacterium]|nr:hypothetical protein [Deltaproteobacteria bacterium]